MKCTSAQLGFAVDDELAVTSLTHVFRQDVSGGPTHGYGVIIHSDATTVDVRIAKDGIQVPQSPNGSNYAVLTLSSWDLIVRAYL